MKTMPLAARLTACLGLRFLGARACASFLPSLALLLAGSAPSCSAAPSDQTPVGAPLRAMTDNLVTLTQTGDKVVLDNGIVTAIINTTSARVVSLKAFGHEMVGGDVYFSMAGGQEYDSPTHCIYSVTKQEPDTVDISCKRIYDPAKGDKQPWDMDIHYVLRPGVSGLYSYAVLTHPSPYRDAAMGEWRTVWRLPAADGKYLTERIYADDQRHWELPTAEDYAKAEVTGIKEIYHFTTGKWAGKYDSKYAYNVEYEKLGTFGLASDMNHVGAWMVMGGFDYFNDGPLKQDLAPHAGINHLYLNRNHYTNQGFTIKQGQEWQKIYGPWLMYVNNKPTADEGWADAKAQVAKEKAQWPYTWLSNPEYAATSRSAVTGKLLVKDALKPDVNAGGAWVGLAQPEEKAGNWQFQGDAYQYWTRARADGSFTIPAVRPGTYTLYAFTTGAVGEYSQQNVTVKPGATTPLDSLTWNVPHRGQRLAWEIGIPDRLSSEFGNGEVYWEPYIWNKFALQYPNPIQYDVAKKNWPTALNYAHSAYLTNIVANKATKQEPWQWRLNFNLDAAPTGDATLTIAYASTHKARQEVYVNDETKPLTTLGLPNNGGNALLRQTNHAKYSAQYVTIPAARLKAGANTITLVMSSVGDVGNHLMYDYLSLELP